MEQGLNIMIGTYTHKVKSYAEDKFYRRLHQLSGGRYTYIVDNTPGDDYYNQLNFIIRNSLYNNFMVLHNPQEREPERTLFHRNVQSSASLLREKFLDEKRFDALLIVESDVIPPVNVLDKMEADIKKLPEDWGILGGLYYQGFHDYKLEGLQQTHHVLSGCSLYKRALIEKFPFRYDKDNLGPFPDALICHDAKGEFSFWNDHSIICEHLHAKNGTRQVGKI